MKAPRKLGNFGWGGFEPMTFGLADQPKSND